MHEFLQGIILGLGVAVPIGPINVLMMNYALQSYTKTLYLSFGAMLADLFFFTISILGVSQAVKNPVLFKYLAIFGSIFLAYMAYTIIKNAKRRISLKTVQIEKKSSMFIKGLLLNLLNPFVIIFWISVSTTTAKLGSNFIASFSGLFLVLFAWITLFPLAIYKSRSLIKPEVAIVLSYISAIILLFFSCNLI